MYLALRTILVHAGTSLMKLVVSPMFLATVPKAYLMGKIYLLSI